MIISVASGKGGTGKTTISTSLALSLGDVHFLDCDVEEPNAHIFLKPNIDERISVGIPVPEVDETKCTFCGNEDQKKTIHIVADEEDSDPYIVFACEECRQYLKILDTRKENFTVDVMLEAIATAHWDYVAQKKEYRPGTAWHGMDTSN